MGDEVIHLYTEAGPERLVRAMEWNSRLRRFEAQLTFQETGSYHIGVALQLANSSIARLALDGLFPDDPNASFRQFTCGETFAKGWLEVKTPNCADMRNVTGRWMRRRHAGGGGGEPSEGSETEVVDSHGYAWEGLTPAGVRCVWPKMLQEDIRRCLSKAHVDEVVWFGDSRERDLFVASVVNMINVTDVDPSAKPRHLLTTLGVTEDFGHKVSQLYDVGGELLFSHIWAMSEASLHPTRFTYLLDGTLLSRLPVGKSWEFLVDLVDAELSQKGLCAKRGLSFVAPPLAEIHTIAKWGDGFRTLLQFLKAKCPLHELVVVTPLATHDETLTENCPAMEPTCFRPWVFAQVRGR